MAQWEARRTSMHTWPCDTSITAQSGAQDWTDAIYFARGTQEEGKVCRQTSAEKGKVDTPVWQEHPLRNIGLEWLTHTLLQVLY